MSKNNQRIRTLCLGIATALTVCGSAVLVYGDSAGGGYTTKTLAYEDIFISATTSLDVTYPVMSEVTYKASHSEAHFVSYLVDNGDYVSEGDPIIQIETAINEIDLKEAELNLTRATEDFEHYKSEAATALSLAEKKINEAKGKEKSIAKLELERLKLNQETEYQSYEDRVTALTEQIEAYHTERDCTTVNATANGQVYFFRERLHTGDTISSGKGICFLLETDYAIFSIDNSSHLFRYNMAMTLTDTTGHSYKAHVASCDSEALSKSLISETAYIVPDETIPPESYDGISATFESIHLEKVFTIPAGAYHNDDNGNYVYILTAQGGVMKQYFTQGRIMNSYCIVLDGLEEGMKVVIN